MKTAAVLQGTNSVALWTQKSERETVAVALSSLYTHRTDFICRLDAGFRSFGANFVIRLNSASKWNLE